MNYCLTISDDRQYRNHQNYSLKDILHPFLIADAQYPFYDAWYFGIFLPGLRRGTRKLIVCTYQTEPIGFALLKTTASEKKICRLIVHPDFRRSGIGSLLLERSFDLLETERPLISISDKRLYCLYPFLHRYGFRLEYVLDNYYRVNSSEYVFNGFLE